MVFAFRRIAIHKFLKDYILTLGTNSDSALFANTIVCQLARVIQHLLLTNQNKMTKFFIFCFPLQCPPFISSDDLMLRRTLWEFSDGWNQFLLKPFPRRTVTNQEFKSIIKYFMHTWFDQSNSILICGKCILWQAKFYLLKYFHLSITILPDGTNIFGSLFFSIGKLSIKNMRMVMK